MANILKIIKSRNKQKENYLSLFWPLLLLSILNRLSLFHGESAINNIRRADLEKILLGCEYLHCKKTRLVQRSMGRKAELILPCPSLFTRLKSSKGFNLSFLLISWCFHIKMPSALQELLALQWYTFFFLFIQPFQELHIIRLPLRTHASLQPWIYGNHWDAYQ